MSWLLLIFITGCNEQVDPDPSAVGYDYFPLVTGQYIDYDVTEETYSPDGGVTSLDYQLRIEVADSFQNDAGSLTYILHRYTREDAEAEWTFASTWSARREAIRAVTVEGNTPYQNLSFPVRNGLKWDGNILNSEPADTYEIDSLGVSYTIDGVTTGPSLTVIQEDLLDFVIGEQDRRYEVYLQGVGLVEKVDRQLNLCTSGNCPANGIESGRVYIQKAIDYGQN